MTTSLRHRGVMMVLSSPSGAGKTTLTRLLLSRQNDVSVSVSVTTRPPRPGEVDGQDYYFISEDRFHKMVEDGELLEHARVFDYHYGTPAEFVNNQLRRGVDVLFDIDWQGTRQLSVTSRSDLVSVFILPPSLKELESRLKKRAQDSDEVVARRMKKATSEISHWQEYDYVVINENLEDTLARITTILEAERMKRIRQLDLPVFISTL